MAPNSDFRKSQVKTGLHRPIIIKNDTTGIKIKSS